MGTAFRPAKTFPASWDAFANVDAFVDEVLTVLAAMAAEGARPTRAGPKPSLTGAALHKAIMAIMAIWCVAFYGMQWRAIGQLCGSVHYRHCRRILCAPRAMIVCQAGVDGPR